MPIDNIHLSGFLRQSLFKNNLIGKEDVAKTAGKTDEKKIPHLGLNQKRILFLVNNADNKYLEDTEMEMLTNLLTACKLSVADIALVNYAYCAPVSYEELITEFNSEKLLIFGISTGNLKLPFNIPDFQIQKFQQQTYLFSPALKEILHEVNLKKSLWNSLQKLFSI